MPLNGAMAARRTSDYRTLASLSRINLLHELQRNGSQTIAELADATGLHHNTAREHLHRLVDSGFVDSETIPSPHKGRPRIRYSAAHGVNSPALRARLELSERRTELMYKLIPMEDVSATAPDAREFDALDDHMEECGIDAEIDSAHTRMVMHNCPYSELAKTNPQVCEVHFTLIEETLQASGGQLKAGKLRPLVGAHTCTLELHPAGERSRD